MITTTEPVSEEMNQLDVDLSARYSATLNPADQIFSLFIDVPKAKVTMVGANKSRRNDEHTDVCMDLIGFLLERYELDPKEAGVVTPYSAQARVIQEELHRIGLGDISVGTVDLYQGTDRKVVVYVMVITREDGAGFAAKCERHVVATTRVTTLVVVIGDRNLCEPDHTVPPSPAPSFAAEGQARVEGPQELDGRGQTEWSRRHYQAGFSGPVSP
ncbi:RNA helicase [Apiospora hydei]|uniref:RNA helicase n=1 Tax=Apiospora hydei TaxID=1337664 RepID=A0ABR1UVI2_9PEZI